MYWFTILHHGPFASWIWQSQSIQWLVKHIVESLSLHYQIPLEYKDPHFYRENHKKISLLLATHLEISLNQILGIICRSIQWPLWVAEGSKHLTRCDPSSKASQSIATTCIIAVIPFQMFWYVQHVANPALPGDWSLCYYNTRINH